MTMDQKAAIARAVQSYIDDSDDTFSNEEYFMIHRVQLDHAKVVFKDFLIYVENL